MKKDLWKYKLTCQLCDDKFFSDSKASKHCHICTTKLKDATREERGIDDYGR